VSGMPEFPATTCAPEGAARAGGRP